MFKPIAVVAAALAVSGAFADDSPKLVGTWKLVSFVTEFQDGSPARPVYGAGAKGYLVYTPEGRQIVLIEGEGRKPAKTDEERAALFNSAIAWTGTYRLDGDKHVLKLDGALNPAFVGAERISTVRFEGERIHIASPWSASQVLPGAPTTRAVTVWERVKP